MNEKSSVFWESYNNIWRPFFEEMGKVDTFAGHDGIPIHYHAFQNPQADTVVLVLTGRGENCSKHAELVWKLWQMGKSVYLMDHRGQGLSGRMTQDPNVGHVEHFEHYVLDVDNMWKSIIPHHDKKFIVAHSMGGLVAVNLVTQQPTLLTGLVLLGPMFGIKFIAYSEWAARIVCQINCLLGRGKNFAPGCKAFDPHMPVAENVWTRCQHRFDANMALQQQIPRLNIGGPSNRWIVTCVAATGKLLALAPKVLCPVLLFQPEGDVVVRNDRQNAFAQRTPKCRKIVLPAAWHEALSETDETVDLIYSEMNKFFEETHER